MYTKPANPTIQPAATTPTAIPAFFPGLIPSDDSPVVSSPIASWLISALSAGAGAGTADGEGELPGDGFGEGPGLGVSGEGAGEELSGAGVGTLAMGPTGGGESSDPDDGAGEISGEFAEKVSSKNKEKASRRKTKESLTESAIAKTMQRGTNDREEEDWRNGYVFEGKPK